MSRWSATFSNKHFFVSGWSLTKQSFFQKKNWLCKSNGPLRKSSTYCKIVYYSIDVHLYFLLPKRITKPGSPRESPLKLAYTVSVEFQNRKDFFSSEYAAVIWPTYCRYDVKLHIINQSSEYMMFWRKSTSIEI